MKYTKQIFESATRIEKHAPNAKNSSDEQVYDKVLSLRVHKLCVFLLKVL